MGLSARWRVAIALIPRAVAGCRAALSVGRLSLGGALYPVSARIVGGHAVVSRVGHALVRCASGACARANSRVCEYWRRARDAQQFCFAQRCSRHHTAGDRGRDLCVPCHRGRSWPYRKRPVSRLCIGDHDGAPAIASAVGADVHADSQRTGRVTVAALPRAAGAGHRLRVRPRCQETSDIHWASR